MDREEILVDGRSAVVANNYDKVRFVIAEVLQERGWTLVCDECSGVYVKNGFTLFVFPNRGARKTREVSRSRYLANAVKCFERARIGWQLEKYGALIATGRLSPSLNYMFGTSFREDRDLEKFIEEVEGYVGMSSYELRNHKVIWKKPEDGGTAYRVSERSAVETKIFVCTSGNCPLSQFKELHVYGILVVRESAIKYVELDKYANVSSGICEVSGEDVGVFARCLMDGTFKALEQKEQVNREISAVKLQDEKSTVLPEEIVRLNFSEEHNVIISRVAAACGNAVPLLRHSEDAAALQAMADLVMVSSEYGVMQGLELDSEVLGILKQAADSGFSIYEYARVGDPVQMQEMLKEAAVNFDSNIDALRREYTLSAIMALKYISTSKNKKVQVPADATGHHVYLKQMMDENVMASAAADLYRNGREMGGVLYVFGSDVSKNARAELRAYLGSGDFVYQGEEWNGVLDMILSEMKYVVFSRDTGMLVSAGNGYVGRQPGGFVFYDGSAEPVYRYIKINGSYAGYGNAQIVIKD